jgi:hypothetical protein
MPRLRRSTLFCAAIYKDGGPDGPGGPWLDVSTKTPPLGAKAGACSGGARTFSTFLSQEDRCACRFCDWLKGRGKYRQNVSSLIQWRCLDAPGRPIDPHRPPIPAGHGLLAGQQAGAANRTRVPGAAKCFSTVSPRQGRKAAHDRPPTRSANGYHKCIEFHKRNRKKMLTSTSFLSKLRSQSKGIRYEFRTQEGSEGAIRPPPGTSCASPD